MTTYLWSGTSSGEGSTGSILLLPGRHDNKCMIQFRRQERYILMLASKYFQRESLAAAGCHEWQVSYPLICMIKELTLLIISINGRRKCICLNLFGKDRLRFALRMLLHADYYIYRSSRRNYVIKVGRYARDSTCMLPYEPSLLESPYDQHGLVEFCC